MPATIKADRGLTLERAEQLSRAKRVYPFNNKEETMQQPDVLQAKRVLVAQLFLTLLLTAAALPFGFSVASSVLIGAVVCLLANSVFAVLVFRRYRAQEPGLLVMRFYGAEVIKLSLVLGLFAAALAAGQGLSLPVMLVAYFAVQVLPTLFAFTRDGRATAHKTRER